jgi:uncharacterized membrane protein YeaQ/YmgE (transglycosylase-associated protein family)
MQVSFLWFLVIGIAAGWIAGKIMNEKGVYRLTPAP